ncbi:hypothetical protein LUZ60_006520 [Juncus effusus]|nr:hypothetical protein LUZ60_006520 [Juncus effusus]
MDVASSYLLCEEETGDVVSWTEDPAPTTTDDWVLCFSDSDQFLPELLSFESNHLPRSDYLSRLKNQSVDTASRQGAVNWILKVNELYRFRPVTLYLSMSYLDRFLSMHSLPEGTGGWPMQLLSVACVSVAAKMEETRVPLLVDLQCIDATSRFLFEPRTVRRMELLLMSSLQWRMHAVTPFDFLPLFTSARALPLLPRASLLIVKTLLVVDFLAYRPSVIAAAALICAAAETDDIFTGESDDFLDVSIPKEAVTGCRQLMETFLTDTCPTARQPKGSHAPPSPIGILDAAACGSCDSQKSSAPATPVAVSTGAEPPPFKRRRLEFGESACTDNTQEDDGKDTLRRGD